MHAFRVYFFILFLFLSLPAYPQRLSIIPFWGKNFGGISESEGFSRNKKLPVRNNLFSSQFGIQADLKISTRISLCTGAGFTRKGFNYWYKKPYVAIESGNMQQFLEVPLLLRYSNTLEPTKWYIELGPFAGFVISDSDESMYLNSDPDLGIILGTGYKIKVGSGYLMLGLRWTHGLRSRHRAYPAADPDIRIYNRTASALIGLSIPLIREKEKPGVISTP